MRPDMELLAQLQSLCRELSDTVDSFAAISQFTGSEPSSRESSPFSHDGGQQAKSHILSTISKIRALVWGTPDFLQHLASQSEILACLGWLGEFQVLACIPMSGNAPVKDIADLTRVPELQLSRVVRLMATVGFLQEPQTHHVAHTPLSASFVSCPSYHDAAMFLSESVAPAALRMTHSVQCQDKPLQANKTTATAGAVVTDRYGAKQTRQYTAYMQHVGRLEETYGVATVLEQLNWQKIASIPNACIVEVNPPSRSMSIAQRLAGQFSTLRYIVQTSDQDPFSRGDKYIGDANSQITFTTRTDGSPQTITDAAVYIIHLPLSSPSIIWREIMAHFEVLQNRSSSLLVWTAHMLPEPGSLPIYETEGLARSLDLALQRLTNRSKMEIGDLLKLIESAVDNSGKLLITKTIRSQNNIVVGLLVKYQLG